jgi:hypothetical protein
MAIAASKASIFNAALTHLGDESITDPDGSAGRAPILAERYDGVRRALLTEYRWNFAVKRAALAADGTPPAFGFDNRFAVPADWLALIGIYHENELQTNYTASEVPHVVEGRFILADETGELKIFYIADIEDPVQFDPIFAEALGAKLAITTSVKITGSAQVSQTVNNFFQDTIKRAKLADAIQGTPEVFEATEWLDSRRRFFGRPGPIV